MSFVTALPSQVIKKDKKQEVDKSSDKATVHSFDEKKRAEAFKSAKKKMKLAASELDW